MYKVGIPFVNRAKSTATPKTAQPGCKIEVHLCRKRSRWLALLCPAVLSFVFAGPVAAQSLDSELKSLLDLGCQNISDTIDWSSPLGNLCDNISYFATGTFSGGNAAITQPIVPIMIQERLQDLRGELTAAAMAEAAAAKKEKGQPTNPESSSYLRGKQPAFVMMASRTDIMSDAIVAKADDFNTGGETGAAGGESSTTSQISPKLSLLVSAEAEASDRDVTHFEDGYDSNIARFTAAIDSQFTKKFLAGFALTYYQHNGDFHTGGDFSNDAFGGIAYASFLPVDRFFIQATAGYGSKEYERTRVASFKADGQDIISWVTTNQHIKGKYDGNEFNSGVMLGYDLSKGAVTFGPRASLNWVYNKFDSYAEKGNTGVELAFDETDVSSLQSRLGLTGSTAISTGFGVLVPQAYGNWVHEFENDQRTENFRFVHELYNIQHQYQTEPPDRNFFEAAVGISAVLPNGWQAYAQYRTTLGHDYLDSHAGALGMRIEF